jgi:O-antigen/teichoic acid export membrane protein
LPSLRAEYEEVVAEVGTPTASSRFKLGQLIPGRQGVVRRDRMLRDGHTLTASSAVTAALGLLYWAVAARRYGPATVGRNAAAISTMMFLAGVAQLNLTSALVRFVPTAGARAGVLVRNAYLVGTGVALIAGVSFLAVSNHLAAGLHPLLGTPLIAVWFVLCTMAWTVFTMQDGVLAGIRRAWMVPAENAAYSLAKVVLVVLLASWRPGDGIFLSWTLALAVSVFPVNWYLFRRALPRHPAILSGGPPGCRELARFVIRDYCGSLCWIAATSLIPLVVINLAGAKANAYFTLSWQFAYMLYLVAANMGTALVVDAAADESHLADRWRATVTHAMMLLGPVILVLVIAAPEILSIFGTSYARQGTTLLRLLVLSAVPNVITSSAVSACRAQRRPELAFTVLASICLPVLVISAVSIPVVGIAGVGWAWFLSQGLVSVMLLVGRSWWLPAAAHGPVVARRKRRRHVVILAMTVRAGRTLKPLVAPLQRGRASWKRVQLSGLSRAVLDSVAAGPGAPLIAGSSRLQLISNESALSVAKLGPPGEFPAVVLKIARSPEAVADLRAQRRNLSTLHADERLGQWRGFLPQVINWGEQASFDFSIENCLAARDARAVIAVAKPIWAQFWSKTDKERARTPFPQKDASPEALLNKAMAVISDLHRRTAQKTVVDERFLARWVDAPLAAIDALYPGGNRFSRRRLSLRLIRSELHAALERQAVELGWTHGDFTLGNIVVGGDPETVVGVVDWGSASAEGIPELDTYHLWLTARAEATGREFGEIVTDVLTNDGLERDTGFARASSLRHRDLVLLVWLNHVAHNLHTNQSYRRQWFWRMANVDLVLDAVKD